MELWVLLAVIGYQGEEFYGVYSSEDKAKDAKREHMKLNPEMKEHHYTTKPILLDEAG